MWTSYKQNHANAPQNIFPCRGGVCETWRGGVCWTSLFPGRGGAFLVGFNRQLLWWAQRQKPTGGQGELSQQCVRQDSDLPCKIVCRRGGKTGGFFKRQHGVAEARCGGSTMGQKLPDTVQIQPRFRNGQCGVRNYRFTA